MDRESADEVIACLGDERKLFTYYRDRYGIGLLCHLARYQPGGLPDVAHLKQSPYAGLLQKPRLRQTLAMLGGQPLNEAFLAAHDHDEAQQVFRLGLAIWGGGSCRARSRQQTSRPGCNLVLQLNFNRRHDAHYRRLGCRDGFFNYAGHPVSRQLNTLAWARIDLDWASGTALIEEIQSDWIRDVAWLAERVASKLRRGCPPDEPTKVYRLSCPLQVAEAYCRYLLTTYQAIWDEAMLWAAISFIREELGLQRIYYHSEASGRLLKRIRGNLPPRSLYSELPRRFCFEATAEFPEFLLREPRVARELRQQPGLRLFRLAAGGCGLPGDALENRL